MNTSVKKMDFVISVFGFVYGHLNMLNDDDDDSVLSYLTKLKNW